MKKIVYLLVLFISFSCSNKLYKELDKELKLYSTVDFDYQGAEIKFSELYNKEYKKKNFEKKLFTYVNTSDKAYITSFFLFSRNGDKEKNKLAIKSLKKSLDLTSNQESKCTLYNILGRNFYFLDSLDNAKKYFILEKQNCSNYAGYVPAWENEEEYKEIENFKRKLNLED
ncbi:MAG: hypothetical protein H6604_07720 [Flavobacteriales bacterium]|nr:hypothetical protein [Flavobacteriales bacterium]